MRNGGNEERRRGAGVANAAVAVFQRSAKAIASLAIRIFRLVRNPTLVSSCGQLIGCTGQGLFREWKYVVAVLQQL